jgi:hypothetical protein
MSATVYSVTPVMVYVFPLLVCPYAKILAVKEKNSLNLGQKLSHLRNRNVFFVWSILTVNATNYREGNFPNPFLIDFLGTAVRMKNPICN